MAATKKRVASGPLLLSGLLLALAGTGCTPGGVRALRDGQRQLAAGNLSEALRRLETAVRLLPTNALAWHELAVASHRAGQWSNAAVAYHRALQLNPDLFESRYGLGCLWLETGQFEAARSAFTACTVRHPGHAESWWRLGLAQLQLRQTAAAEQAFREMQRLAPTDPRPWNGLGLCAVQRHQATNAARLFAAALQVRSNYAPALLNLALVHHRFLRDPATALEYYRQYVALQPPPPFYAQAVQTAHALELALAAARTPPPTGPGASAETAAPGPPTRGEPSPPPGPTPTQAPGAPVASTVPPLSRPAPTAPAPTRPPEPVAGARTEPEANRNVPVPGPAPTRPAPGSAAVGPGQVSEVTRRNGWEGGLRADDSRIPGTAGRIGSEEVSRSVLVAPLAAPPSAPGADTAVTTSGTPEARTPAPEVGPLSPPAPARWWERLSPLRWARSTPAPEPRPTPLPDSAAPTTAPTTGTEATEPGTPQPRLADRRAEVALPARPAAEQLVVDYPRYVYLRPAAPSAGDVQAGNLWFAKGLDAQRDGRFMEALQAYQAAVDANPAFFEAYYNFVVAALQLGRVRDALRMSEYALALRPDSKDARFNFALSLRRAGYFQDAAEELEQLLRRHPNDTRAWLALGNLYAQQLGQPERARQCYQRLLALEPGHPEAEAVRYWLSRQSDGRAEGH